MNIWCLNKSLSWGLGLVLGLLMLPVSGRSENAALPKPPSANKWEILKDCRLADDSENDGDTFHTLYNGKKFIFRLYFVDAPEIDLSLPDRVWAQAADFNTTRDRVLELGKQSKEFAADFLRNGYTIVTCWQKAKGSGASDRFFAIAMVGESHLSRELVKRGLARIQGQPANWPDASSAILFTRELRIAESEAKREGAGGWAKTSIPSTAPVSSTALVSKPSLAEPPPAPTRPPEREESSVAAPVPLVTTSSIPSPPQVRPDQAPSQPVERPSVPSPTNVSPPASKLVDLNSASKSELQTVSGIGPVLAERIIESRPYENVEDLTRVKGIKEKTLAKLRPHLTVQK